MNISYKLRKFSKKDIDSLTKHANNSNIAKWLTNEFPHPYYRKDAETFIEFVSRENPPSVLTVEINKEACGAIGITVPKENNNNSHDTKETTVENDESQGTPLIICDKQGELGYWLSEKYWNKGIMTSAIKKMVEYGFKTFDIDCIFATPFVENVKSQKVLKKVGFVYNKKIQRIIKSDETYEVSIFSIKKD